MCSSLVVEPPENRYYLWNFQGRTSFYSRGLVFQLNTCRQMFNDRLSGF